MELNEIRNKIDNLDEEIIKTIAKRINLVPDVAKYKRENNIERYDEKREKEIFEKAENLAKDLDINPKLIMDVLKLLINESHRIEKELM